MASFVNRKLLDFDFEKICSVTLQGVNVYVCLQCGKYFGGRNEGTPAYMHALHHEQHRLYMNLVTLKVYSLPDDVEFVDEKGEFNDIRAIIAPHFTSQLLAEIDGNAQLFKDLHDKLYLLGYCGLNNIKANDYVNVVIQLLAHIPALRDSFLLGDTSGSLADAWKDILTKLWNPNRFKAHTSPHEFLQAVTLLSGKRFSLTQQADPVDFLLWFINTLSVQAPSIEPLLKGQVRIESAALNDACTITCETKPFVLLSLDLPPRPLFSDPKNPTAVPQVALTALLEKFNGGHVTYKNGRAFTYALPQLPPNLFLQVQRRVKGRFGVEWNDTLVKFVADEPVEMPADPGNAGMAEGPKYRLMANIYCRKNDDGSKAYGVHLRHRATGKWLEVENLQVREAESHLLFLSESLLQHWERID